MAKSTKKRPAPRPHRVRKIVRRRNASRGK